MGSQVATGAVLQCTFGVAPVPLVVDTPMVMAITPAANIMANKPMANVATFGMCSSLANPTVASATAAALGVLTPMPCIPVTAAPWAPGCPTCINQGMPSLNNTSKLMCNWGGLISINFAGQVSESIP